MSAKASSSSELHLVTFATREQCVLLHCWLGWYAWWLAASDTKQYHLQLQHYIPPPNITGAAAASKIRWRHITLQKLAMMNRVVQRLPLHAQVLFSDLDVLPLQPYSRLVPLPEEITCMPEPPGHGGRTGRHVVNTGLIGVRVSPRTRRFFSHASWLTGQYPKLMDQDIVNWLLLAKPNTKMHHRGLRWTTWPRGLTTGVMEDVSNQTVAFHAIFAVSTEAKLARMREAYRRAGANLARPSMCDATATSSCARADPEQPPSP